MIVVMRGTETESSSWIRIFRPDGEPNRRAITRRLIDDCDCDDPETGNEHYRAEIPVEETGVENDRPRVEPSNLLGENGEQWRED